MEEHFIFMEVHDHVGLARDEGCIVRTWGVLVIYKRLAAGDVLGSVAESCIVQYRARGVDRD